VRARYSSLHRPQFDPQRRNIVLDDGPHDVVIEAKIAVDQAIARRDEKTPGDLRID